MKFDLGQVFTPEIIAKYMVSLLTANKNSFVLDPCFGHGVFISELMHSGYNAITGYEIDPILYEKFNEVISRSSNHIRLYNMDFLSINDQSHYDAIVMNPPYVRQEKINNLDHFGINKDKLLSDSLFKGLKKTSNLYMYFILKAIDLLRDKGELIAIFPSTWMDDRGNHYFYSEVTKSASIRSITNVRGFVFGKEYTVGVSIVKIVKELVSYTPLVSSIKSVNGEIVEFEEVKAIDLSNLNHIALNKIAIITRGITTGYNDFYFKSQISDSRLLKEMITSSKSITGYSTLDAKKDKFLGSSDPESSEVKKYIENTITTVMNDKTPKTIYNMISKGVDWPNFGIFDKQCSGIIFNYMIRENMKFILNEDCLVRDNFYIIKPKHNKFLILTLLNNHFTYYRLEKSGKFYGGGMLKLQKYDISELCIVNPDIISVKDTNKLSKLGLQLINIGGQEIIDEITLILSKYEALSAIIIKEELQKIKNERLKSGV